MDCEIPEFYNETYPRARKEHRCCECGGTIHIGERYARCVGKLDDVFCETQHVACRDFAAEVNGRWGFDGECFIPFGGLNDAIANASDFADSAAVVELQLRWAFIRAVGRGEAA